MMSTYNTRLNSYRSGHNISDESKSIPLINGNKVSIKHTRTAKLKSKFTKYNKKFENKCPKNKQNIKIRQCCYVRCIYLNVSHE